LDSARAICTSSPPIRNGVAAGGDAANLQWNMDDVGSLYLPPFVGAPTL